MELERRFPKWRELSELIQPRKPALGRSAKIERAATIWDLRKIARRRAPRAVFDYVDGGSESEVSLRRSREAYSRVEFKPQVLVDVTTVETATEILGFESALPLALSPTGFTRMMHAEGESSVAGAAEKLPIPYALSTLGTTNVPDLRRAAPTAELWFQLYVWKDREFSKHLISQAKAADYRALVLTVDTPVAGARLRDIYNGLSIPPRLSVKTIAEGSMHPSWWWDLMTTEPLEFASLKSSGGTVAELVNRVFDPGVSFDDVAWLKEQWDGPVLVKGVQTAEDAAAAMERGADGVIVSNHGGRQLDRAPTTLEVLPEVVDTVGDRGEVLVDGGVMHGADIAAAVAFGARAAMVGRAYLYGLMAGGQRGVERALEILTQEYTRTLQLMGVTRSGQLDRSRVKLRP